MRLINLLNYTHAFFCDHSDRYDVNPSSSNRNLFVWCSRWVPSNFVCGSAACSVLRLRAWSLLPTKFLIELLIHEWSHTNIRLTLIHIYHSLTLFICQGMHTVYTTFSHCLSASYFILSPRHTRRFGEAMGRYSRADCASNDLRFLNKSIMRG